MPCFPFSFSFVPAAPLLTRLLNYGHRRPLPEDFLSAQAPRHSSTGTANSRAQSRRLYYFMACDCMSSTATVPSVSLTGPEKRRLARGKPTALVLPTLGLLLIILNHESDQ